MELMRRLISELNLTELTIAYGMTETSPVSFQTVPSDPMEKRTETVGRILPNVVAKIVDSNNNIVPIGTPGELRVSGYNVHKGYWNNPEQSAAILTRGPAPDDPEGSELEWLSTGDVGVLDEEGYLRSESCSPVLGATLLGASDMNKLHAVVGRIKDIIIRGGENLFPAQIENILSAHPVIKEAAAISVPDEKYGEVVGVWIVREHTSICPQSSDITAQDVRSIVKQGMNPQNAPAWVWFVGDDGTKEFVSDQLPKTGSGKVQKNDLRDWSRELAKRGIGLVPRS